MLSILGWLFMGLFVGSIGQAFTPVKEPGRIDGTVVMGVCGALIGGLISGSPFRAGQRDAGFLISLALAGLGSLVVLAVHRLAIGLTLGGWLSNWASFFITLRADGENLDESQRPLQQRPLVGDRRLTGH
jgi:uncharacterized membrane protein YeaQ/YmgE (transglycosylase-associated protein family)